MNSTSNQKEESFRWLSNRVTLVFYLTCVAITITVFLELFLNDGSIRFSNDISNFNRKKQLNQDIESCDIFRGRWLPDPTASLYTNFSCAGMPPTKNCLLNGRNDTDFLNWKWKPDDCELPRFSATTFLSILRGKKMAFIGDSLARNQAESLVCLLSTVETPYSNKKSKDDDHQDIIWEFPEHNFTLSVFWSPFLVTPTEIAIDGGLELHLHLDTVEANWSEKLPSIDYAVFSASHWYFRESYLHEGGRVTGCTYCRKLNTTALEPGQAIRAGFRAALRAVNACDSCKKIVSFVRTYSPEHFENGSWQDGGTCNRTRPVERDEVNLALPEWGYSRMQVQEVEMARREGKAKGNEFEVLDVTEMMAMRVDGHPGRNWPWGSNGGSDCLHWCLPGPIDTWNGLLLDRIKRFQSISS